MKIALPDETGALEDYRLSGTPMPETPLPANPARVVYSAAHVVADPFTPNDPSGPATVDWAATMRFRHHLHGLGLGIAEAMDTRLAAIDQSLNAPIGEEGDDNWQDLLPDTRPSPEVVVTGLHDRAHRRRWLQEPTTRRSTKRSSPPRAITWIAIFPMQGRCGASSKRAATA